MSSKDPPHPAGANGIAPSCDPWRNLKADSMISDDTWADLRGFYNDKKLIELVILAGQYKTVAYYQNSLRLPLPEGNMGLLAR